VRAVVVHGHYYQPPRDDPWLEAVEAEATAAPYHDWNERIERESYRAVTAARVPSADGRIARIENALAWTSFDVGPTLLLWLEREAPDTYAQILAADRASRDRLGSGNAIAHPYHHIILPLATRRDKTTEVRWGIADFRRRFGRAPEGLWLPETAADDETLDVLAEEGIAFTVLAPNQVAKPPAHGFPGRYRTAAGREIAVFIYDGPLSHDVAFGTALQDGVAWARRLLAGPEKAPSVVAIATDGETYGHHHRFGEMALARMLAEVHGARGAALTNFGALLAAHPPAEDVTLVAPSSWSCVHGVERWRSECGCQAAPEKGWHQRWRAPLRQAVEWLAGELHAVYEREGGALFADPWAARDAYGASFGPLGEAEAGFAGTQAARGLSDAEAVRARELLEMERDALRMFTSCAWFFDDIGGLEPLQVLRYGAHAIELAGAEAARLETGFARRLGDAVSNDPAVGDARRIFLDRARPALQPVARVAASFAAARRIVPGWPADRAYCYAIADGGDRVKLTHRRTGRSWAFQTSVQRSGELHLAVSVVAPGGALHTLQVADLLERERSAVRATLTASLAARALAAEDTVALAAGTADAAAVYARALARALRVLAAGGDATRTGDVTALLDLFALQGWPVPFDAQTGFWRWWSALPVADARALATLARRLGFSAEGI
jgi:hypothetical protein